MALVSAAIVAFIVVGILATHSPGAQRAVALVPVPSSVVPAIPPIETATPLPVAEATSSPTVATAATSPVPPRATSGGKPSAAPSALQHGAPPPPGRRAEDLCCTPDGTLQLRFHDCVNNCKN